MPSYRKAAVLTVKIRFIGIAVAVTIELLCTIIQYYKIPVIRRIVSVYIEVSQNAPLMMQLLFIYYGLPQIGIRVDTATCGVAGLTFLGGSYMSETFRSGTETTAPIQEESAYNLGLSKPRTFSYVILLRVFSASVPTFMANVIFLLRETSVFSAISLMDLMLTARDLIGLYYKTAESLFLLVTFYFIILLLVSALGSLLEGRSHYAEFGS